MGAVEQRSFKRRSFRRLLNALGPGVTTGAADDDPSGIATYSQAGAQFGFTLAWTMFLTLPWMGDTGRATNAALQPSPTLTVPREAVSGSSLKSRIKAGDRDS
jgi:hypothetical protein